MLYICEKFSNLTYDDLLSNQKILSPILPFLTKTVFELKDELLLHSVLKKFSDFLVRYADEAGAETDLRQLLDFTASPKILSSSYSQQLVSAVHKVATARLQKGGDPRRQFDLFELVQIPIVFSTVGILVNEPWSRRSPEWNGKSPIVNNMKRILFRISEELLRPNTLNKIHPRSIVRLAQGLQLCQYTLPAVPKAMLIRMSDPVVKPYTQLTPSELAEFMYRIAMFKIVHHVVIERAFQEFSTHMKKSTVISKMRESSCCSVLNALKQYRIKNMELIALLISRILEVGLTIQGLHVGLTVLTLLQIKNQLGDSICKEAIRLELIPKSEKWNYGQLLKRLTHYFKDVRVQPIEAAKLIQQTQIRIDEKALDIKECVSALASINRSRKQGNVMSEEVKNKAISISRTIFDHMIAAEKSLNLSQITDTLLASYIGSLSGLNLGEDCTRHLEYALAFLLKHIEVLKSLHPKTVPLVLFGIKSYKGNPQLRQMFIDAILDHLTTPHVMRQMDGDSFSGIVLGLSSNDLLHDQSECLNTMLNRIIFDTQLMISAPVQTCVGLVRAISMLRRKEVLPVENATAIVFQSLLPKLKHLKEQPHLIQELINCTASLRTSDPAVLSVIMYVTSLIPIDDLTSQELGYLVQDLLLIKVLKVNWINKVQSVLLQHIKKFGSLEVHVAKWVVFAVAKIEADAECVPVFLKACVKDNKFNGKIHNGDIAVMLWSICRLKIYPFDFMQVCANELLVSERHATAPFEYIKPNNLITILTGIASSDASSKEINEILTLLIQRSIASGSIHMMTYSAIKNLVTCLVNRRIAHSEFFKLAREVIAKKMKSEVDPQDAK
eukprot:TRINITY_DN7487_c0_g1_i2.p1 TRINITY_DN7487_c0_g1~~TRINITY_DN7487_c0_g1_i2.p1  ORF type:complete len:839 (+),score=115.71 TRINITY_DN7487_c0_g1_i2:441-2957(+)